LGWTYCAALLESIATAQYIVWGLFIPQLQRDSMMLPLKLQYLSAVNWPADNVMQDIFSATG